MITSDCVTIRIWQILEVYSIDRRQKSFMGTNKECYEKIKELLCLDEIRQSDLERLDYEYYNNIFKDKKIAIYGIGNTTRELIKRIPSLRVSQFIDSHERKADVEIEHCKVDCIVPEDISDDYYIIIASVAYEEIANKLLDLGYNEGINFISYHVLLPTPSEMINRLLNSEKITDWECEYYEKSCRLQRDGSVGFCMNTPWLSPSNGNAFLESLSEIKSSIRTKLIEISIMKGTYCFCNTNRCAPIRNSGFEFEEHHSYSTAIAAFDKTCNLHCESCRNKTYIDNSLKVKFLARYFCEEMIPIAEIVNLAGDGEALFSPNYLKILEEIDNEKKLLVLTNGTKAEKTIVDMLSNKTCGKIGYSISVDSSDKETYEMLRRSAKFDELVENLTYLSKQVHEGKIKFIAFNYVISKKNINQIVEFVRFAEKMGALAVNFTMLGNWGTFSEEEYKMIRVTDDKSEPIAELSEIMDNLEKTMKAVYVYSLEKSIFFALC